MSEVDGRNTWFEWELHRDTSEEGVRYDAVEAILARRIRECEQLGILSILCQDVVPDNEKMDRVERDLFTQITQYSEYDEPVNECLSGEVDLSDKQWDRIASRLEDRLLPVMRLPLWEQQVLASEEEPTAGYWEAFESHLFDRISRMENQCFEQWEQFEIQDEPVAASSLERAEVLLENHIRTMASRPLWEQVLAADEIVPLNRWERVEVRLFSSFDDHDALPIRKQPFWFFVEHYSMLLKGVATAGLALAVMASSFFGVRAYNSFRQSFSSVVYQAEGNAASDYTMAENVESRCSMVAGGSVTLVNKHGYVALHNRSAVTIEKMSRREARYQVSFSGGKEKAGGEVSFFVKKRSERRNFTVETPHYRIEVVGTYFKVEAAPDGSVTTRVLEGVVRVKDSPLGDLSLKAGQSLAFDTLAGRYRILDGGRIVAREEVENVPDVTELIKSPIATFHSSVAGVKVYIDGKFRGTTPLKVRLPRATYRIALRKAGYFPVDTIVEMAETHSEFTFDCVSDGSIQLAREQRKRAAAQSSVSATVSDEGSEHAYDSPESIYSHIISRYAGRGADVTRWYTEAQQSERSGKWQSAISLYQKVFDAPGTTPLRREDVLFSIGKLQAEHITDVEVAKKSFLTYVALFPEGSFAGESWLRLAELEFQKNQESAIHYYLKFFHQFPRHPRTAELKDRVGVIYLQQKQYDKAIGMFDQALSGGNLSADLTKSVATHLHRALQENGERQRAALVRSKYMLTER